MDEMFHKKPEITPPAIASSSTGLHVNVQVEEEEESGDQQPPPKKGRKNAAAHDDEMKALLERKIKAMEDFNALFKEYLQKRYGN